VNTDLAARHRQAFLAALGDGVAIVRTGGERRRSNDTHFRFRPHSDFWYLTAFPEPDAVAVFAPGRDEGQFILFVNPKDPELETWNGRRAGVEGAVELYGADEAHSIDQLEELLPDLLKGADQLHYATGFDADADRLILEAVRRLNTKSRDGVLGPGSILDPGRILHEMRLFKSEEELVVMRRAAAITDEAHRAAMASLHEGQPEYEIESLVDGTFRRHGGWGPGYTSICAGGDNACVLHYTTNDMVVQPGAMLLLDAGCELDGYTADVTRTFPASGSFSPAQRELYGVVLAAQVAAVEAVRPGARFSDVHDASLRGLIQGLLDLEFLSGSVDEHVEGGAYRTWYMHKTSHWLGIDVHDVGGYFEADGSSRKLEPGMVLTVEPGLYITGDDETAPERFRGLGVRIEDDIAVTADGHENLTDAIPKTIEDVEAAC
jgi:Xaa-Pro aminopeptidase